MPTRRKSGVALPGAHVAASGVRLRGRRDAGVATGRAEGVVEKGCVFVSVGVRGPWCAGATSMADTKADGKTWRRTPSH